MKSFRVVSYIIWRNRVTYNWKNNYRQPADWKTYMCSCIPGARHFFIYSIIPYLPFSTCISLLISQKNYDWEWINVISNLSCELPLENHASNKIYSPGKNLEKKSELFIFCIILCWDGRHGPKISYKQLLLRRFSIFSSPLPLLCVLGPLSLCGCRR